MAYKSLSKARGFARFGFHDAKIYKTSAGKYEVLPYSARKPFKSWKFVERVK